MSVKVHVHAAYVPEKAQFQVELQSPDQRWIEMMAPERFVEFANDAGPLKIGGVEVSFHGDNGENVDQYVRRYFKQVADSYTKAKARGTVPGQGADSGTGKAQFAPTAKQIKVNGDIIPVIPKNGKVFTYEELLALVECEYIEQVTPPGGSGAVMIVDEEGKPHKPVNEVATQIWQEGCEPGSPRAFDQVVGTVLLCHRSQLETIE